MRVLEKEKSLEMALMQIERQFGRGSIMKLGAEADRMAVEVVPTGSLAIDIALGVGGMPRGRVIEVFGPESSGKTTIALSVVAAAQRMGGVCAYVDAENALDPQYCAALGVNIDELLISQPDTGEQALEITELLVRSAAVDVVVIDSVAALVPRAEIEGDIGDSHVGLQARLMSQALRKLSNAINRSNTIVLFINQLREKIGVMFGNPEVTPGGRALKFYSSVRLDLRKIDTIKNGTDIVGNRVRARVVKNKVAPPFRNAEFDIMYGEGISKEGDILDLGVFYEVVKKSGAWYMYKEDQLGQGRENGKAFLKEHVDISKTIEGVIREKAGLSPAPEKKTGDLADATPVQVTPIDKASKTSGKSATRRK
ncbi:MAG: recombinase RecA [Candidatus Anoxymicrobium japonicum]|uniref:Protein RecA n=1 Tax=Candidatus Anoxymicrobium japonicum TaxID=2013648 RepID=A0A2N3G7E8_9ACTN|nr:MAG: recombinase RecA [Candidatus Anoxymicrobium japonicum]